MADSVLRNTQATLSVTFFQDEAAEDADASVTVNVFRENGEALYEDQAATSAGEGVYTFDLEPQAQLDVLRLVWSGTFGGASEEITTFVEIVGGFYASVSEIRQSGKRQGNNDASMDLSNTTKFTTAQILDARSQAETLFEQVTRRTFVPRYCREHVAEAGYLKNTNVRAIYSATTDEGVEVDVSDWKLNEHTGHTNFEVCYEHGEMFPPADLKKAFLKYVRSLLLDAYDSTPDPISSINQNGMFIQYAQASANRPTGIPFVDATLSRYKTLRPTSVGGWA